MIKNNVQLKGTEARLQEIRQQVRDLKSQYSGIKLDILVTPFIEEAKKLRAEIEEYQKLQVLSLEEGVQGMLQKPVLLDNISELLAKLRIASGFTQQELATRLGWQQSNLSRFENENYHSQTVGKIVEYASFLGVWLHVTPSLTEKPVEVIYKKKETETPLTSSDTVSTLTSGPTRTSKLVGADTSTISNFSKKERELVTA